jgi:hypothetical protein
LLNLTTVNSKTAATPDSTIFYIRSFEFTVDEFCTVLGLLMDASYDMNDKLFHWLELADSIEEAERTRTRWTVRYCGRTDGAAWSRHVGDLSASSGKSKTWFGRFLKATREEYPEIIDNVQIDVVTDATSSSTLSAASSDLREQLLISLFGLGVANAQAGGVDVISPFNEDDQDAFLKLQTNTSNLLKLLQPCLEDIEESIETYIDRAYKYTAKNPISTGADKRDFSDKLRRHLRDQATPAMLSVGCALLTSIASDIGQDDHDDSTFYESGRRSANIVNSCFDHLTHWEKPTGSAFKPGATRAMSKSGYLPFVDLFPWFKKDEADYPKAGELLLEYLRATKPLIVLTYGQLPSYHALASFKPLTIKSFFDTQRSTNVALGSDYYIQILGVPHLRTIGEDEDEEVVIIPCYHPGYLAQAGLPSVKATTLFFYVHQLVWFSMGMVLNLVQDTSRDWTRKELCGEIVLSLQKVLSTDHDFGRAFARVKQETIDATNAFAQGKVARRRIRNEGQPKAKSSRSVSPKKAIRKERKRNRKLQITNTSTSSGTAIGGYEIYVHATKLADAVAPRNDRDRHILSWKEPSFEDQSKGHQWTIGPLILPDGVLGDGSEKRFIYYTGEGLDIRSPNGESQGEIRPLHSGQSRNCTLPISALVVYAKLDEIEDQQFLEHWEDVTGVDIDEYLMNAVPTGMSNTDMLAGRYPAHFFDTTTRSLPVPALKSLHKASQDAYVTLVKKNCTPANPGDMLWLLSRFFQEICDPKDGISFNVASASESPASVYRLLARFCHTPTYQHHPHLRTLRAVAHLPELGITERILMSNIIVIALHTLAASTKKTTTITLKSASKTSKTGYASYKVKDLNEFHNNILAPFTAPQLKYDIEIIEESEETDQELDADEELGKRKHESDSDFEGDDEHDGDLGETRRPEKMARGSRSLGRDEEDGPVPDDVMLFDL